MPSWAERLGTGQSLAASSSGRREGLAQDGVKIVLDVKSFGCNIVPIYILLQFLRPLQIFIISWDASGRVMRNLVAPDSVIICTENAAARAATVQLESRLPDKETSTSTRWTGCCFGLIRACPCSSPANERICPACQSARLWHSRCSLVTSFAGQFFCK